MEATCLFMSAFRVYIYQVGLYIYVCVCVYIYIYNYMWYICVCIYICTYICNFLHLCCKNIIYHNFIHLFMLLLIRIVDADQPPDLAILCCIFLYGITCNFANLKQIINNNNKNYNNNNNNNNNNKNNNNDNNSSNNNNKNNNSNSNNNNNRSRKFCSVSQNRSLKVFTLVMLLIIK